jgi:hypothetical protein
VAAGEQHRAGAPVVLNAVLSEKKSSRMVSLSNSRDDPLEAAVAVAAEELELLAEVRTCVLLKSTATGKGEKSLSDERSE